MSFNRGALDLIAGYDDDTSDDEVPGCRVSTKRTHSDDDDKQVKYSVRFPVPQSIISRKGLLDDKPIDNPSEHEGRLRSFAHERGNWATYVYIPYESNADITILTENLITLFSSIDLKHVDDYHVSLTRTVSLRYHWIQPFTQSIKERTLDIKKFFVMFNGLKVYCNEERTRTFLGLQIVTGYNTLNKLIDVMNTCLEEFHLPHFYKDPSFHMSIAWCLGDQEKLLNALLIDLSDRVEDIINKTPLDNLSLYVNYLQCKSGNKTLNFMLS